MIETRKQTSELDSVTLEVRKWKEEVAGEHGFDIRAIGIALQTAQNENRERIVSRAERMQNKTQHHKSDRAGGSEA